MAIRDEVVSAFRPDDSYTYSHVLPFKYTNYIDGRFQVAMLYGAARMAYDKEMMTLASGYLTNLELVGPDARNFAPSSLAPEGWIPSETMPGFSYKMKPQGSAAPLAISWAMGTDVPQRARLFTAIAPLYGWFLPLFKQHLNTVMLAHLALGKIPPESMMRLAKDNPIYSYLYNVKCSATYRNTGAWPAKDYSFKEVSDTQYTPLCSLVGQYLQMSLI